MRKRSKRLCSLLMALVMALSLLPTAVFAAEPAEQTYVKVTEAPEDWSGTYLIVNEDNNAAFDGSLTALDAVNDYKTVTIEEGATSPLPSQRWRVVTLSRPPVESISIRILTRTA